MKQSFNLKKMNKLNNKIVWNSNSQMKIEKNQIFNQKKKYQKITTQTMKTSEKLINLNLIEGENQNFINFCKQKYANMILINFSLPKIYQIYYLMNPTHVFMRRLK